MRRAVALGLGGFLLGVVVTLLVLVVSGSTHDTFAATNSGALQSILAARRGCTVTTEGYNNGYMIVRCPRWTLP